ncbi:fimbrial protein [Citrobacter sp. C348]|uniref:fimbrial protein n=1 Tax=Citrobacter sp. C348 TaxID=3048143 RepID=UPI0015E99275|nr:fimbrial protein [Citrobacter freundii]MBA7800069.1 type 1 fimbrial protein [Citrobacter freundii]QMD26539.1 type 1 fimbrial protein [Citrobacter freundii]WFW14114.1 fimbrial protein [Citrobacter freundii]
MKKLTIAAIAMAFAGSAFAAQDSAEIHFAGEVQTNICTASLLGGGTTVQLDPTDVKTVSSATTDSVMKKDFAVSLDCTAQGSKDAISGASYATVTGYLAPGNGTSINSSTPALDNTDVTAAGAQGVGFQVQNKDASNAVQTFTDVDQVAKVINTTTPMVFSYNVGYLKTGAAAVSGGLVAADAMFIAQYQ